MSDFGTLTEGQLIDQRDEAIEQRDVAVERCDDARRERDAAIKKYEELARALFATGLDASGQTPLEMVTRLADELRSLRGDTVIMCADQDVVRFGIEVPADVAWKFAHAVGHCNKYLAGTTATVAIPAIDSITVSPEQYQAIEDAISKPAAPTQALVDLFRDARAITKRGGAK